jgi:hypothetical protein
MGRRTTSLHPELWLKTTWGAEVGGTFARITVKKGHFTGTTTDGATVDLAPDEISDVEVEEYSTSGTTAAVVAGVAAAALVLVVLGLVALGGLSHCPGGLNC